MYNKVRLHRLAWVVFMLIYWMGIEAQTALKGNDYLERSKAMIDLWTETHPFGGDLKYTGPYYWAKIYANKERNYSIQQISDMLDRYATNQSFLVKQGSEMDFYAHSLMHGYMIDKKFLPSDVKEKVKGFMERYDLCTYKNASATLNMQMMMSTAAFMAAEEWSDLIDSKGHNSVQILAANKPYILKELSVFFHRNCPESDAVIYFATNLQYIRMLAEFAKDNEVKNKANTCYQYLVAGLIPAWNWGIYVGTPSRNKDWEQLRTGSLKSNSISALGWLYFGNKDNQFTMIPSTTVTGNLCDVLFWVTYQRNVLPLPSLNATYLSKKYPYEHIGMIDDVQMVKYHKYTYQSENYGLATQAEILYDPNKFTSSYAWKETKRFYLAWQSKTPQCYLSVCQDNLAIPKLESVPNGSGYGENPYHRVLQYKKASVGIYNVPFTYANGKLYRIYVPFARDGILKRIENKDGWVLCHTGSMMFAFKTIEPYTWNNPNNPKQFQIKDHDILTLKDTLQRRGAWLLETTEITSEYAGMSKKEQLEKFSKKLTSTKRFETSSDYSTSVTPRIKYYSLDGDTLDITFFPPNTLYSNQYIINNKAICFSNEYIFKNDFMEQQNNSDTLFLKGADSKIVWYKE